VCYTQQAVVTQFVNEDACPEVLWQCSRHLKAIQNLYILQAVNTTELAVLWFYYLADL